MELGKLQQEVLEGIKRMVDEARELDYSEWLGTQFADCDKNSRRFNPKALAWWLKDEGERQEWDNAKLGTVWVYYDNPKALKALEAEGAIKIEETDCGNSRVTLIEE